MAVAGRSEESVHGLSVLFAALCVPVAFWAGWSLFGRRTAWIAALLAAVNPCLTQYAQEGRMYALVALLGLVSLRCWLLASRPTPTAPARARRSASRSPRSDALHPQLGALLRRGDRDRVARGCCGGRAEPSAARLLRTGLVAYGVGVVLYLPWLPNALYQAAHTGRAVVALAVARRAGLRALAASWATSPRSPSCSPPARASSRCCGPIAARSTGRRWGRCC